MTDAGTKESAHTEMIGVVVRELTDIGTEELAHPEMIGAIVRELSAIPIAQVKKPRRSPLRLRFLACTLETASSFNALETFYSVY